jgi:hypothetical protein
MKAFGLSRDERWRAGSGGSGESDFGVSALTDLSGGMLVGGTSAGAGDVGWGVRFGESPQ